MKNFPHFVAIILLGISSLAASDLRLVDAVKRNDNSAVDLLLKSNVNVNESSPDGATPISWAAYNDDLNIAERLLRAGANPEVANNYGVTPLFLACENGSSQMVDKLLTAGATPTAATLMSCARTGNLQAVELLLAEGVEVNFTEPRENQTPLMWAVVSRHSEIERALISRGADVNAHTKQGFTPLMFAAQQGDLNSTELLIASGALVNDKSLEGDTPLLIAAASGHEKLAIYLLGRGADPNASDESGISALHLSLMKGLALINRIRIPKYVTYMVRPSMIDLVRELLAHGANPNARLTRWSDKLYGVTNGDIYGYPGSVSPVGATPFLLAALSRDAVAMRILASGGADPLMPTEENVTPLMVAAGLSRWRTGAHPLNEEEETNAIEAVKLAIELGGEVNAADSKSGLTALHGAAFNGSNRIIQLLVEKGANLDARDKVGQTPLHKSLNIKPVGASDRNLIPVWAPSGTAELLIKLGATPVDPTTPPRAAPVEASSNQ